MALQRASQFLLSLCPLFAVACGKSPTPYQRTQLHQQDVVMPCKFLWLFPGSYAALRGTAQREIEIALQQLEANPPKKLTRPPFPIRARTSQP